MSQVYSEQMREALEAALPYLDNSDSPGGCDGRHKDCAHCRAIAMVRDALSAEWRPDPKTVEVAAEIAAMWRISKLNNGDLTDSQLNDFLNEIGPNIAATIRSLLSNGSEG